MRADGRLFLTALEENAVKVIEPSRKVRTVVQDEGLC
jgi:hypothetical protein